MDVKINNTNKILFVLKKSTDLNKANDGKHLYLKESTMLPEDAVKYGYLPKKEAKAEYNKKMVEICKILNLPISLI